MGIFKTSGLALLLLAALMCSLVSCEKREASEDPVVPAPKVEESPVPAEPVIPEEPIIVREVAEEEPESVPAVAAPETELSGEREEPISASKAPAVPVPDEVALQILQPSEGSFYNPVVHVTGMISGGIGLVDASWEVMGTGISGTADIDNRGRFSFSFPTDEVSGDIRLRVAVSFEGEGLHETSITLKDYAAGPLVDILKPVDGDIFRSETLVHGRVWNNSMTPDRTDGLETLSYRVAGTERSGEVSYGTTGNFSFYLDTSGLSESIVLEMKALDYRGRTSVDTVTLSPYTGGPWIAITEPADGSLYRSNMTVRGRVADSDENMDKIGEIEGVSWSAGDAGGEVRIDEKGFFTFEIETLSFPEQVVLTVSAVDRNGRTSDRKILLRDDGTGPFIDIRSPPDGSEYEGNVTLEGVIYNREDSRSTEGEIASASWEILELTDVSGEITVADNGRFRFDIPDTATGGDVTVEILAEDRHGNTSTEMIRLIPRNRPERDAGSGAVTEISLESGNVEYRSGASVTGKITGPGAGDLRRISWSIRETELRGSEPVTNGGSFTIRTDTRGLTGTRVLILEAGTGPNKITRTAMLRESDLRPRLEVTSPAEGAIYRSSFRVAGSVSDRPDTQSLSELKSLRWQITGTGMGGEIEPDEKGQFSFTVSTEGVTDDLFLRLAAEDVIGHVTERNILVRDDGRGPYIRIDSPSNGSTYSVTVECKGVITDDPGAGSTEEVKSARWSVRNTSLGGRLSPGPDGGVSFSFSGIGLPDIAVVEVAAVDKNGHESIWTLTLNKDAEGPVLIIESPGDLGYYGDTVQVSGRVSDYDLDSPSIGELKTLSWHTAGNGDDGGYVYVEQSGQFRFSMDTDQAEGPLQIVVEAEDLFGNITAKTVRLLDGKMPPIIQIESPGEGSFYGAGISIEGRVIDPYAGDPDHGGIKEMAYEMTSARYSRGSEVLSGSIVPGRDGRFICPVNTLDLRDEQRLILRAYAANGNVAEKTVVLKEGGSGIPSFSVIPGSGRVRVDWDNLPFADSYNLRYVKGVPGDLRSGGEVARDVLPPLELQRLENGARYSFVLEGSIGGADVSSDVREIIPLSEQTLKPRAKGGFQQISLEWSAIPGADRFVVYRAYGKPEYFSVLETVAGTSYLDTSVQYGTEYFYRIAPEGVGAPPGDYTGVSSLAAPPARVSAVTAETDFSPLSLTVFGDYAFVPAGDGGLRILDISDPARSRESGRCDIQDARAVVVRGDFAYLAAGQKGLKIINIADPRNPLVVGGRNTRSAGGIDVSGDYAYIADGPGGFRILDIRNESSPARIASLSIDGVVNCKVRGDFAYLAAGENGVRIVDVSVPDEPVEMGIYFCSDARDIHLAGDLLYVADGQEGLIILDVSNPEHPGLLGRLRVPGSRGLDARDQYVFLAVENRGLVVIDVLDPTAPELFDETPSPGAMDLGVKDDFVLLADTSGLRIIRTYLFGTSFRIAGCLLDGMTTDVTLSGGKAFTSSRKGGVHIIDVSRPEVVDEERIVASIPAEDAESVAVWKNNLVVMDGEGGVRVYLEPWDGEPVDIDLTGYAADAAISGSILYAALKDGGVGIVELSGLDTGGAPEILHRIRLDDARGVEIWNNMLLVADGREGLVIFSLEGDRPGRLSTFSIPGIKDISCGESAVAAVGTGGVTFVDISDPENPVQSGFYPTRFSEAIEYHGGYFFLSEGYKGFSAITLSDNGRPMRVSTCPTVYALAGGISGNYAFVADGDGLSVIRIIVPNWLADSSN